MSTLIGLQRAFQDFVYRRAGPMEREAAGSPGLGARERLAIYADAYRLRLIEVLADDYPALKVMAGERFAPLARDYIETHPSRVCNARWYGAELPAFLRAAAPWSQQPALAEMAALEWAMTLVFDAADEPLADIEAAGKLRPEAWSAMAPVPITALRRLALRWNVGEIRKAVDRKTPPPAAQALAAAEPWLVWRKDLTVYYRLLESDEAAALDAARNGARFAQLCETLARQLDESQVAARAAGLLKRWLDDRLIRELRLD